jgi:hypothetical protein
MEFFSGIQAAILAPENDRWLDPARTEIELSTCDPSGPRCGREGKWGNEDN